MLVLKRSRRSIRQLILNKTRHVGRDSISTYKNAMMMMMRLFLFHVNEIAFKLRLHLHL